MNYLNAIAWGAQIVIDITFAVSAIVLWHVTS